MTTTTGEDFIRAWLDCYSRGDVAGALACYTDDVEFEDPIFGEHVQGREALRAQFESFFHSGVTRLAFRRWTGGATGGAVEWEWTADWGPGRTFLGYDVSERRFVVRDEGRLLSGIIDRLVLLYDQDRLVAADILDYKTDSVDPQDIEKLDGLVAHYQPQLEAYRKAVAKMYRLSTVSIVARLLFVSAGVVRTV